MNLEWKQIENYNYEVSNTGQIRNISTGKILKKAIHKKRYYRVSLAKNGKNKSFLIHRLVAEAFCKKSVSNTVIHHIDNNGFNNFVDNLIWTTQSNNVKIAYDEGYCSDRTGINNPNYRHGGYIK